MIIASKVLMDNSFQKSWQLRGAIVLLNGPALMPVILPHFDNLSADKEIQRDDVGLRKEG